MTRPWKLGEWFIIRHPGFPFDWMEQLGFSTQLEAAADACLKNPQAKAEFERLFAEERVNLREKLHARAGDLRVQEAVFLSSPSMYDNVWKRYVAKPVGSDTSDNRRVERQIYSYLQRLCAKNETTSFFGPMGYGEIDWSSQVPLEVSFRGPQVRRTFFAFWAVTELSKAMAREAEFKPHLPVRINPLFDVGQDSVHCAPLEIKVPLNDASRALIEALRTEGTLERAARKARLSLEAAEKTAGPLLRSTFLLRGFPFTSNQFRTYESLRASLEEMPPSETKTTWKGRLEALEAARELFENAPLSERGSLLEVMEKRFSEWTGQPARRGEGTVYADRLIIYEEASSPFALKIGAPLARVMEEALSPPLELSSAYGEQVQSQRARDVLETLKGEPGPWDFLTYAIKARPPEVSGSKFSPVPPVELPATNASELNLSETCCGTSEAGGRYALPDVCLSRTDGGHEILLARVHHHLLLYSWLCAFHPNPDAHRNVAEAWLSLEPSARTLVSLGIRRRNKGFYQFPGKTLTYALSDAMDFDATALAGTTLRVRKTETGLELHNAEGTPLSLYLALDDFSSYPPFAALAHKQVLHAPFRFPQNASPRIRIGKGIYQRARWTVQTNLFAKKSGPELLLALHALRRAQGWPRFVFVRSQKERKPYLMDTLSPFALDLLKHMAKESEWLSAEEMYPPPECLVLKDSAGRYTCELRMQAVRYSDEVVPATPSEAT